MGYVISLLYPYSLRPAVSSCHPQPDGRSMQPRLDMVVMMVEGEIVGLDEKLNQATAFCTWKKCAMGNGMCDRVGRCRYQYTST